MWTWLASPPVLIVGLLASLVGITQAFVVLKRWIVPLPRRGFERKLGRQTAPHQRHHDPEKQPGTETQPQIRKPVL